MKKIQTIVILSLLSSTLYAEPSVYSSSFVSPQKSIKSNKKTIALLTRKISEQKEQIDGLKSVVEGLNISVHELQQSMQPGNQKSKQGNDLLLHDLGEMIDKINMNYVTKDELKKAINKESTPAKSQEEPLLDKSENQTQLYSEGVRLFVKHRYDEAKKRFIQTANKKYKSAASNYYLGEISYYTKKYEDAIFYYKKSAGLNDKASYVDTLLLHTAISLEQRGEKEQAKVFYENIIANYIGKKTAEIAKEKLKEY